MSTALCCYGSWLAEIRRESPMVIFQDYLEKVRILCVFLLMNDILQLSSIIITGC